MDDPVPNSAPDRIQAFMENAEFISDCCRFSEQILTQDQVTRKYKLDAAMLDRMSNDEKLIGAIELEKIRRVRNGDAARERAQGYFTKAPDVLNSIMSDDKASARHRIESAKELRVVAANTADVAAPAMLAERFTIKIVLGPDPDDTLTYAVSDNKSSKLIEHDSDGSSVVADDKRGNDGNEFL
jgi:hypothetical protein